MNAPANMYADSHEALVVSLARTGDRDAFAELVRRRQSWIRNLMRRCCHDEVLADDLAQQVFLQAWSKIKQVRQAHTFGAWLKQLAIRTWLQHQRKQDMLIDADNWDSSETGQSDQTALAMDLDSALAQLPAPVRLCVVLSYHECMSHAEIAHSSGLPLGTVKSHVRRGSEKLKQLLSHYQAGAGQEVNHE